MTSDVQYQDDVYNYDPSQYVEQGQVMLPPPGNALVKVTNFARRQKDGADVVDRDGFPTISLNRIEVIAPEERAGIFNLYQDVRTGPFPGNKAKTFFRSVATDIVRSIDKDQDPGNFRMAVETLERLLAEGNTFNCFLTYVGTDTAWAKAEIERQGASKDGTEEQKKAYYDIWRKAERRLKDFTNPDGSYRTQTVSSEDGSIIKAKLRIARFYPSTEVVDLEG